MANADHCDATGKSSGTRSSNRTEVAIIKSELRGTGTPPTMVNLRCPRIRVPREVINAFEGHVLIGRSVTTSINPSKPPLRRTARVDQCRGQTSTPYNAARSASRITFWPRMTWISPSTAWVIETWSKPRTKR
jgi:hypothetical protein